MGRGGHFASFVEEIGSAGMTLRIPANSAKRTSLSELFDPFPNATHLLARHLHMESISLMSCNPVHVLFNHVDFSKSPPPMSPSGPRLARKVHSFPELLLLTHVSRGAADTLEPPQSSFSPS